MSEPPSRACPFCAEEIKPAAIVCKHCGRDLAGGASPGRVSVATPPGCLEGCFAVGGVGAALFFLLLALSMCHGT